MWFDNKNDSNQSNDNQTFPLGTTFISNPDWLFKDGVPSGWKVTNTGGFVVVTPKYGSR